LASGTGTVAALPRRIRRGGGRAAGASVRCSTVAMPPMCHCGRDTAGRRISLRVGLRIGLTGQPDVTSAPPPPRRPTTPPQAPAHVVPPPQCFPQYRAGHPPDRPPAVPRVFPSSTAPPGSLRPSLRPIPAVRAPVAAVPRPSRHTTRRRRRSTQARIRTGEARQAPLPRDRATPRRRETRRHRHGRVDERGPREQLVPLPCRGRRLVGGVGDGRHRQWRGPRRLLGEKWRGRASGWSGRSGFSSSTPHPPSPSLAREGCLDGPDSTPPRGVEPVDGRISAVHGHAQRRHRGRDGALAGCHPTSQAHDQKRATGRIGVPPRL